MVIEPKGKPDDHQSNPISIAFCELLACIKPLALWFQSTRREEIRALFCYTVKLGNKERFVKELIGIKEPFPVTNLPFTSYE
jgi:hypothetical protein